MTPSIIVIGAGMGGLAATLRLTKAGFHVQLIEARSEPGGLAGGVDIDGFHFDAGPYVVLDREGFQWALDRLGLRSSEQILLDPVEDTYEVQIAEREPIRFYSGLERTAEPFEERWRGSGKRYEKFVLKMARISESLRPMLETPRPNILGLIRSGGIMHAPFLMKTLSSVLASTGLPAELRESIAIWTHVAGQTTSEAPSLLFLRYCIWSEPTIRTVDFARLRKLWNRLPETGVRVSTMGPASPAFGSRTEKSRALKPILRASCGRQSCCPTGRLSVLIWRS